MKNERQKHILELISQYEIETQDDMINILREEGYNVTQATISRDMRELKLTKVLTKKGTYKYTINRHHEAMGNVRLNHSVASSIVSIDYAGNNVVVKTMPGLAQAVASGIDSLNLSELLGCVGGDDTIIIVTRSEDASVSAVRKIKELMGEG